MTASLPNPAPRSNFAFVDKAGLPLQAFYQWVSTLDAAVRSLAGAATQTNTAGSPMLGPLVNAASDSAAATAGVPVNGLYRNGNAVQIRLT